MNFAFVLRSEMLCGLLLPVLFLTINSFNSVSRNEIAAAKHEDVPFNGNWIRSLEKDQQLEETPGYVPANEKYAEFSNLDPRTRKVKESVKTKRTEKDLDNTHKGKKKKKKTRRKKKKPVPKPRRFVKTTVVDKDRESNMTDSIEVSERSKPVDIIVHIKMSD